MSAVSEPFSPMLAPAFERLLREQHPLALARAPVDSGITLSAQASACWSALAEGGWLELGTHSLRVEAMPELALLGEASGRSLLCLPLAFSALVLAPLAERFPALAADFLAEPLEAAPASGRIDFGSTAGPLLWDWLGERAGYYQLARADSGFVLRRYAPSSAPVDGLDAGLSVLALDRDSSSAEWPLALNRTEVQQLLHPFLVFQYAHLLGAALSGLELAVAYAGERRQFGRAIGEFQAVKHALANAWVALDNGRYALEALHQQPDGGPLQITQRLLTSGARLAARVALQVHGAIGFAWEHDIQLYLKRVYKTTAQMEHVVQQLAALDQPAA